MQIFHIVGQMSLQPLLILLFTHGQRIARTAADEEMAVLQNGFILVPGGEVEQRILADDKGQRCPAPVGPPLL